MKVEKYVVLWDEGFIKTEVSNKSLHLKIEIQYFVRTSVNLEMVKILSKTIDNFKNELSNVH